MPIIPLLLAECKRAIHINLKRYLFMMTITVPTTWFDVSIEKFPLIYDIIQDKDIDPIDREIRVISILTDMPVADIEKIRIDQLKELIKSVNFIVKMEFPKHQEMFRHNGFRWIVNYDISKLSAGDFISISKLTESEESIMANLPQLVAMFIKPYKVSWFKLKEVEMDYNERLRHINSMSVGVVYPLCVFFCKVIEELYPTIEDYLVNQMKTARQTIESELNSKSI
jgi:hypothetical protein